MSTQLLETPVGKLVAERPGRALVLERWGLDYCCGGKKPLGVACGEKQLNVDDVVRDLLQSDAPENATETDWTTAPLSDLTDHIIHAHHDYLREALPRLTALTEKVRRAHGDRHPELDNVTCVFRDLRNEMELHMMKEERILFPLVKRLEQSDVSEGFHCGSIRNPIQVMEAEHDNAGWALARLRELTGDYTAPQDACNTFRVMLDALAELEADMHTHVHLENNILFPRAIELEVQLRAASI
jgi:regulator of cell morphogenesis and NO signaling